MATQPDGKLLLVGTSRQQDGDFAMVRFERDGTLDASCLRSWTRNKPPGCKAASARSSSHRTIRKIVLRSAWASAVG